MLQQGVRKEGFNDGVHIPNLKREEIGNMSQNNRYRSTTEPFDESEPEPSDEALDEGDQIEDEEDENESELARKLYFFAQSKFEEAKLSLLSNSNARDTTLTKSFKAITTAKSLILDNDEQLRKILVKSTKRVNDVKVPPGSSLVRRSIDDDRFVLCILSILEAKMLEYVGRIDKAIESITESLLWFPRSIEGNYLFALYTKVHAGTIERYKSVAIHFNKSVMVGETLPPLSNLSEEDSEIMEAERRAYRSAQSELALLLCQEGKFKDAVNLLSSMSFSFRLSREVLRYVQDSPSAGSQSHDHELFLRVFDNALSTPILNHISNVFRPTSPFWIEHDYDTLLNCSRKVGYFSYLYPIRERVACSSIEQIIDLVRPLAIRYFPEVSNCSVGMNDFFIIANIDLIFS